MLPLLGMLAGAGISAAGSWLTNKLNSQNQYNQQEKLQKLQQEGWRENAKYQKELDLGMLKDSFNQNIQNLKDNNMSIGLAYGQGAGGGSTVGTGAPAPTGGQADAKGMNIGEIAQLAMLKAQKDNIEADTELKKASAENTGADTELKGSQLNINKIQGELQGRSLEDQLSIIQDQERIYRTQALVGENTAPQQIEKAKQELTNLAIDATAKEKGIQLQQAQIQQISQQIQQKWKELNINETTSRYEHQDRLKAIEEYTNTTLKAAGIAAAGHVVSDIVQIATRRIPTGSETTTQTTTYDKWGKRKGETYTQTYNRPNK